MTKQSQPAKVKVILISGFWRSGSTILGRVLGELRDTFDAGELAMVWDHGLSDAGRCGCQLPLRECDIWREVFQRAYGGFDRVDTRWMDDQALQMRHLPLLLLPGSRAIARRRLSRYVDRLDRLYSALADVTQARVLVDASKSPTYAYTLGLVPSIDLHVVHLVRDPRGVQYSILRRKHKGDPRFQQHSVVRSTLMWDALNVSEELLRLRTRERYLRLRYEEFVARPLSTINQIKLFIGEPELGIPPMTGDEFLLSTNHTANGSNSRFETGLTPIRLDNAWQSEMDASERARVTRLTMPLLGRYGYQRSVVPRAADPAQGGVGVEGSHAG